MWQDRLALKVKNVDDKISYGFIEYGIDIFYE